MQILREDINNSLIEIGIEEDNIYYDDKVPNAYPSAFVFLEKQVNTKATARRFLKEKLTFCVRLIDNSSDADAVLYDLVKNLREEFVKTLGFDIETIEFYWAMADMNRVRVAKFEVVG